MADYTIPALPSWYNNLTDWAEIEDFRVLREHCYSLALVIITSPVSEIEDFGGVSPPADAAGNPCW